MSIVKRAARLLLVDVPLSRKKTQVAIDPSCLLGLRMRVRFSVPPDERLYLEAGQRCVLNCQTVFESTSGTVTIGHDSDIGNSTIICHDRIEIGSNVTIAWGVTLYDHDSHSLDWKERRRDHQTIYQDTANGSPLANKNWATVKSASIVIEDDAWIGMNATILKGVTIGQGAIVGAGSVVTKDVPPFCVAAGNPAQIVKRIEDRA